MTACLFLCGCTAYKDYASKQIDFTKSTAVLYPPKPENYNIELYFQGAPARAFDVIGELKGRVINRENIEPLLKEKARQVGADAVIDIETVTRNQDGSRINVKHGILAGEMDVVNEVASYEVTDIRAKAIKYHKET